MRRRTAAVISDTRPRVPGDPEPPVTPDSAAQGGTAPGRLRFRRAVVVRSVAHL